MSAWRRLDVLFRSAREAMPCRCQARSAEMCECGAGAGRDALDALERELLARVPRPAEAVVSVEDEISF